MKVFAACFFYCFFYIITITARSLFKPNVKYKDRISASIAQYLS